MKPNHKILVTGAGGFLGLRLVKALRLLGHTVHTLQRQNYPELQGDDGIRNFIGSIENRNDLKKALDGVDVVFHVASKIGMWGDYQDFYRTNVLGTRNIISLMKEQNIKYLIYTSTPSVVFDRGDIKNGDETLSYPNTHLNFYGETKRLAEVEVLNAHHNQFITAAIRPHLIFGPGDKQLIPRVIKAHRQGRLKIIGDGSNLVDVSYIDNVVDAHLDLYHQMLRDPTKVNGKAYFIGQDKPVNLWDFTNTIMSGIGLQKLEKKIPTAVAYFIGACLEGIFKLLRIKHIDPPMTRFVALQLGKSHYFSHQRALEDFGHFPKVGTEEGLKRLIDDYRSGKAHIL